MTCWKQPGFINIPAACSLVQGVSSQWGGAPLSSLLSPLSSLLCWQIVNIICLGAGVVQTQNTGGDASQLPSCHHHLLYNNNGKLSTHEFEEKCSEGKGREARKARKCQEINPHSEQLHGSETWQKPQTMLCSSMGPPWICFNHLQIILVLVFYHILYNDNTY